MFVHCSWKTFFINKNLTLQFIWNILSIFRAILKEKFGEHIEISEKGKKIPTRRASDYGSDVDTDDLADDSDLDVTTCKFQTQ